MSSKDTVDKRVLKAMRASIYRANAAMSARYYSIAHAYESIFEINLQFFFDFVSAQFLYGHTASSPR